MSLADCVCARGFFASTGSRCERCPANASFFCPGNTSQLPCPEHTRTVAPGAFVRELRPATIAAAMEQNGDWFAPLGYV